MKGIDPNFTWILYNESNGNRLDTFVCSAPTYGRAVRLKAIHQLKGEARLSEPRRVAASLLEEAYERVTEKDGDTYWRRRG